MFLNSGTSEHKTNLKNNEKARRQERECKTLSVFRSLVRIAPKTSCIFINLVILPSGKCPILCDYFRMSCHSQLRIHSNMFGPIPKCRFLKPEN